ncbi:hypothetical protein BGZ75_004391 [Mortierella antarctica]|uniref:C2H2-type domain-containing protein n=1 Tax=Mortierella alpina TaxID=64518 RepID=A0A9P8CZ53_MORAP|nr:hypothetical protein BGZ75_004391 [Mortierella antarctica]KAG9324111.1 hypothetical protein KVV02_008518 [Mortierella alpina]
MAFLTPASILATMDPTCTPSDMLAYNGHHLHHDGSNPFFEDSDSDSSYSGASSHSSFSTGSMGMQHMDPNALNGFAQANMNAVQQQGANGQTITYHYFCNFPMCDYHSARSDPVKRHRDTHYPDYKPYTCNYCQSSSARRDSTREHCLKQHKDDSENAFRYDATIPKPEGWIAYEPKRGPWPPIMV